MKYALVTCCCFVLAWLVRPHTMSIVYFAIGWASFMFMLRDKSK